MFRIDCPLDAKEQAVISRRRQAEEARKLRIFNPHERVLGKDLEALKEQIKEKQERQCRERQLEEAWLRERQRQQLVINELERRTELDKRKVWEDVQEFRKSCQRFEDRREFDLNDKRRCAYAERLHDEDVRNGPASMQKFEGEDLSHRARIVSQNLQRMAWWDAQIAEKKQNQQEFEEADKMYEQRLREMGLRAYELSRAEAQARCMVEKAYMEYNCALAQENAEKRQLQRCADEEATMAHQLNMYHSEMLNEVTDCTTIGGPFRVSRQDFKGSTDVKRRMVKEEQLRQAMDKKRREKEEESFDAAWENQRKRHAIATRILDTEIECRNRDKQIQLNNINKELACEQKIRQDYMNNLVYRGTFTEPFFDQFNTTTR